MGTAKRTTRLSQAVIPAPPPVQLEPVMHGDQATIHLWLMHYWQKLQLPDCELSLLAITQDRREYMDWTGKRLNTMALGCYCYVSAPVLTVHTRKTLASSREHALHRHLIFVESDMQPKSIEVTIAHELIHLSDRVHGTPRRHQHHGYDAIAADEAAITGYALDDLRLLLHEESLKREQKRRERRPIRYLYACPNCGKTYPRTRRYSQAVSCSSCDKHYNPLFRLLLTPAQ